MRDTFCRRSNRSYAWLHGLVCTQLNSCTSGAYYRSVTGRYGGSPDGVKVEGYVCEERQKEPEGAAGTGQHHCAWVLHDSIAKIRERRPVGGQSVPAPMLK